MRFLPEWLPFVKFKRIAREYKSLNVEGMTYNWAKKLIVRPLTPLPFLLFSSFLFQASGNYMDSFVSHFLQREGQLRSPGEEEEDAIKWCSAALYLGGADTVSQFPFSVPSCFSVIDAQPLDCIRHDVLLLPDGCVPRRAEARAGGDREHPRGRASAYAGRPRCDALCARAHQGGYPLGSRGTARHFPFLLLLPSLPLTEAYVGLRHRAKEDDVYSGFHIPKDATVIANIWLVTVWPELSASPAECSVRGITHDPELYADPHTFKPDRHLGAHPETDPYKFVFGFGRRACPGKNHPPPHTHPHGVAELGRIGVYLAELSLFLNISNILATFNIGKPMDSLGHDEIAPEMDWTNATVT